MLVSLHLDAISAPESILVHIDILNRDQDPLDVGESAPLGNHCALECLRTHTKIR